MIETTNVLTAIMRVDFLRLHLNLSIIEDVIASRIDTAEVRAANITITKKIRPMNSPNLPRELNTFGSVMNISPGPADIPSFPENANTAGIIIIPARSAIPVSKISIWFTDLLRFTSFFMYEP